MEPPVTEATKGSVNELVRHVRLVHFTLFVVSVALLMTVVVGRQDAIERAYLDSRRIEVLAHQWSPSALGQELPGHGPLSDTDTVIVSTGRHFASFRVPLAPVLSQRVRDAYPEFRQRYEPDTSTGQPDARSGREQPTTIRTLHDFERLWDWCAAPMFVCVPLPSPDAASEVTYTDVDGCRSHAPYPGLRLFQDSKESRTVGRYLACPQVARVHGDRVLVHGIVLEGHVLDLYGPENADRVRRLLECKRISKLSVGWTHCVLSYESSDGIRRSELWDFANDLHRQEVPSDLILSPDGTSAVRLHRVATVVGIPGLRDIDQLRTAPESRRPGIRAVKARYSSDGRYIAITSHNDVRSQYNYVKELFERKDEGYVRVASSHAALEAALEDLLPESGPMTRVEEQAVLSDGTRLVGTIPISGDMGIIEATWIDTSSIEAGNRVLQGSVEAVHQSPDGAVWKVPLTARVLPFDHRRTINNICFGEGATGWPLLSFKESFPELAVVAAQLGDLGLSELRQHLESIRDASGGDLEVIGVAIPRMVVSKLGPWIIAVLQLYLWLHLSQLASRFELGGSHGLVPWVGLYGKDSVTPVATSARVIAVLSIVFLPAVAIAVLAISGAFAGVSIAAAIQVFAVLVGALLALLLLRSLKSIWRPGDHDGSPFPIPPEST